MTSQDELNRAAAEPGLRGDPRLAEAGASLLLSRLISPAIPDRAFFRGV